MQFLTVENPKGMRGYIALDVVILIQKGGQYLIDVISNDSNSFFFAKCNDSNSYCSLHCLAVLERKGKTRMFSFEFRENRQEQEG